MRNKLKTNFENKLIINLNALYKEIIDSKYILIQLIKQYLKLKYRRTVFGYFWTLLNPLLMLMVLGIVFSTLLKIELKLFIQILFSGLFAWNLFSQITVQTLTGYINNEYLLKKIYVSKILFPLSISIALFLDSIIFFIVIYPLMIFLGIEISLALIFLPIALFVLFIFSLGIALIGSIITVFFRDLQWLVPVLLQALFFLTPILYDRSAIIGKLVWLNNINPMTQFVSLFKEIIFFGNIPSLSLWLITTLLAIISVTIGIYFYLKYETKIIYRL